MKFISAVFQHHPTVTTAKGVVGVAAAGGGVYVDLLPHVEAWLRIFSLVIGCAVGIATFVSIVKHRKRGKNSGTDDFKM